MYGAIFEPESLKEILEEENTPHKKQKRESKQKAEKLMREHRLETALMFSEHIETD